MPNSSFLPPKYLNVGLTVSGLFAVSQFLVYLQKLSKEQNRSSPYLHEVLLPVHGSYALALSKRISLDLMATLDLREWLKEEILRPFILSATVSWPKFNFH